MINFLKTKTVIIRIFTLMALILPVLIPVKSWVLAENEVRYFSSDNATYTSDFGVENPEGMAYFSGTNSFVVWGMNKNERMISLRTETSKKTNFTELITNPLAASFDNRSNNLFSLDAGNKELQKIKVDSKNAQPLLNESARFKIESLNLSNIDGMAVDPATGQLFVLDAGSQQILALSPDSANGSTYQDAANYLSLANLSKSGLRGVAFNPTNSHLYVGDPTARKVYEVTKTGDLVSTYDISYLELKSPSAMLFAPSQDATDDPNIMSLYILDSGQPVQSDANIAADQRNTSERGQIVELSLQAPAALPSGTTLLPATLVRTFDTSNQAWNPSSPDPAGIDYWPAANRLVISDSEVEEMRPYWQGSNVFLSTTSGNLTGTCSTMAYTGEPTGVAVNPNNNHIFIAADYQDLLFEISLGQDGQYCTSDDVVTETSLVNAYGVTDAEDVAYGNNTVFIAGGDDAEVFVIPLGADGVVGGGDDGPMTHWDTNSLGFADAEGIGFNHDAGTLFIVSTKRTDRYLGEFSTSGTLLKAYNLSFMPDVGNIRSDVTYAPGSQNASVKNIYIASRGIDNDSDRTENDGKVWEIAISNAVVPTATTVIVPTATNVTVPTPTNVVVPTPTTASGSANVQVNIGNNHVGGFDIPHVGSINPSFVANNGPVKITSSNNVPILASMQAIWREPGYRSSYSELMGLPKEQLSTEYWFPWYNNLYPHIMDQGFRIANINATSPNTIEIWMGNTLLDRFDLGIAASTRVGYAVDNGPIRVICTTCTGNEKILAAMRVIWREPGQRTSYSELMGLPKEQLSTEYWFPWYNNAVPASLDQGFRIANVDSSTHTIQVRVGTTLLDSFALDAGASVRTSYFIDNGPIRVVCTDCGGGGKILAAMRVIWQEPGFRFSYSELMGTPKEQLSKEYWFPWYNNAAPASMDQGFRIANVDTSIHTIQVWAGTTLLENFTLTGGASARKAYTVANGPVRIICTTCTSSGKILAAMRVIWQEPGFRSSYTEMMGLPVEALSTEYWFPWYNNVDTPSMNQTFRISVP
ncbi:MAG TPA: hypothetical protein VFQ23_12080 [Anaerolineales bacterium]|nr:hypothetical protein [Anaerolineales bacterium]